MKSSSIYLAIVGLLLSGCMTQGTPPNQSTPKNLTGPININCGDHWLEIDIAMGGPEVILTVSGDSISGDDLVYQPEVDLEQDTEAGTLNYTFSFRKDEEANQVLAVATDPQESFASGIYARPEMPEIYMTCQVQ